MDDNRTLYVGLEKPKFFSPDESLMQVSIFQALGLDVVVVTGVSLKQLQAEPKLVDTLNQLLKMFKETRPGGVEDGA